MSHPIQPALTVKLSCPCFMCNSVTSHRTEKGLRKRGLGSIDRDRRRTLPWRTRVLRQSRPSRGPIPWATLVDPIDARQSMVAYKLVGYDRRQYKSSGGGSTVDFELRRQRLSTRREPGPGPEPHKDRCCPAQYVGNPFQRPLDLHQPRLEPERPISSMGAYNSAW